MSDGAHLLVPGVDPSRWSYRILPGRQTVGRSVTCDVHLVHPTVSPVHAEIRKQNGVLQVLDLGSRDGTFVNGGRVSRSVIHCGDNVGFGGVNLEVADADQMACSDTQEFSPAETRAEPSGDGAAAGVERLSQAQRRVFRLLLHGHSERDVATRLHLSSHTVHTHVKQIYRALGVHSRAELLTVYLTDIYATVSRS